GLVASISGAAALLRRRHSRGRQSAIRVQNIPTSAGGACVATLVLLMCVQESRAQSITLGDQDFVNGTLGSFVAFESASVGEPAPFDYFRGTDLDSFSAYTGSWTFAYPPTTKTSASITIGMYDHDSAAVGEQVRSFTVDGSDLTALLNGAFDATGGKQAEY